MATLLQHLQLLVASLECVGFVVNDAIFCKLLLKARNDAIHFLYLLLEEHRGWCSVEPQQQNLSVYFFTINILKQTIEWSFHWGLRTKINDFMMKLTYKRDEFFLTFLLFIRQIDKVVDVINLIIGGSQLRKKGWSYWSWRILCQNRSHISLDGRHFWIQSFYSLCRFLKRTIL